MIVGGVPSQFRQYWWKFAELIFCEQPIGQIRQRIPVDVVRVVESHIPLQVGTDLVCSIAHLHQLDDRTTDRWERRSMPNDRETVRRLAAAARDLQLVAARRVKSLSMTGVLCK